MGEWWRPGGWGSRGKTPAKKVWPFYASGGHINSLK